jgi:flagellin
MGGYGLSSLSERIVLNLDRAQSGLATDVAQLSSGLRITSAADDPSGLAIAEGLSAKVAGYDQAASNVQDANNALTVADGALQTVTDILQRLRSLAVQANDTLISATDRTDLQAEADQLRHEIDSISQTTQFNGCNLLDGIDPYGSGIISAANNTFGSPHLGTGPASYVYAPANAGWTFSQQTASGGSGITAYSAQNADTQYNYATVQSPPSGAGQVAFLQGQGTISQALASSSPFDSYVVTFNVSQRAYEYPSGNSGLEKFDVEANGISIGSYTPTNTNPSQPAWSSITTAAFAGNTGATTISFVGGAAGTDMVFIDDVNVKIVQQRTPANLGNELRVQSGAVEGDTTTCALPIASTSYLGVSSMSFLSAASAAVAESAIDTALTTIGSARAQLGAQMVALQTQGTNDSTAFVNLTASESAIRDTNVSAASINDARDQILVSVGTSVLANTKHLAALVEGLFS